LAGLNEAAHLKTIELLEPESPISLSQKNGIQVPEPNLIRRVFGRFRLLAAGLGVPIPFHRFGRFQIWVKNAISFWQ
jgi:hypothetical protein